MPASHPADLGARPIKHVPVQLPRRSRTAPSLCLAPTLTHALVALQVLPPKNPEHLEKPATHPSRRFKVDHWRQPLKYHKQGENLPGKGGEELRQDFEDTLAKLRETDSMFYSGVARRTGEAPVNPKLEGEGVKAWNNSTFFDKHEHTELLIKQEVARSKTATRAKAQVKNYMGPAEVRETSSPSPAARAR